MSSPLQPHHQSLVDRFVAVCQADSRVTAALQVGSYIKGTADAYSDIDLIAILADETHDTFVAERETFMRQLGELAFLEDFEIPSIAFFIYADGVEGELEFCRSSEIRQRLSGPYRVLLDKTGLLTEPIIPVSQPPPPNQTETLRRQIYWFWHELSHFITATGRGQLWMAFGQLEVMRRLCVNLLRLEKSFIDPDIGEEAYFKVEQVLPADTLLPLQESICAMEPGAMLAAVQVIFHIYQPLAMRLAQKHGLEYPLALERVMLARLEKLSA